MALTVVKLHRSPLGLGMPLSLSSSAMPLKPFPSRHMRKMSRTIWTRSGSLATSRALHSLPGLRSDCPFRYRACSLPSLP
ncbi:MAG: hypothetical protein AMK72_02200 [Planctomycetes bacterium SM23_25]|nr:MAG: hypothetical protein AMS14_02800 [Planctomycetes bacterium DG_20]KPK50497.1 MAG: hypothetical protein AMK72_02200 [Planctomycetes bacterium SM23_25]